MMFGFKGRKAAVRLIAVMMTIMMLVTSQASMLAVSYGAEKGGMKLTEEGDGLSGSNDPVSPDKMADSMDKVVSATNNLKDASTTIADKNAFGSAAEIFTGFVSVCSTIGTITGAINGSVNFLKIIGVMKDSSTEALINISDQLTAINEKLKDMDTKLDKLSEQMSRIEAKGDFNSRGITANQMVGAWREFSTHYMEEQMNECMRQYEVMLRDGMKDWIENKKDGARQTDPDDVMTNRVVVKYKRLKQPWRSDVELFHNFFSPNQTLMNFVKPDISKDDVTKVDPYTIYQEDFDGQYSYLVLDDYFLPARGDITWDINTYRSDLKAFVLAKLKDWKAEKQAGGEVSGNLEWYSNPQDYPIHYCDDFQLEDIADDVVSAIIYRVLSIKVNESADFSTMVNKQFGEYCDHVGYTKEGVDAMLKTLFLTNAFEYEAKDTIQTFCDQMTLKTGVYGVFTMEVLGMSKYIKDTEKEKAATQFCDAVDTIDTDLKRSLTGHDDYCYVTNSIVRYGEMVFSGKLDVDYSKRGTYASYYKVKNGKVQKSQQAYQVSDSTPLVGDTNALVISYFLNQAGETMDHKYLKEHFSPFMDPVERSAMITSLNGESTMQTDAPCLMKVHHVVGNWFTDNSQIYLNNLPSDAGASYLAYRQVISGSTFNGKTGSLTLNKPFISVAAYGESHAYWVKDESAVMGGPCNDVSFTESVSDEQTGRSFFSDVYYTKHYDNGARYNALYAIPYTQTYSGAETPDPLGDLEDINLDLRTRAELIDLADSAEEKVKAGGWTKASSDAVLDAAANARKFADYELADPDDLAAAKSTLETALSALKALEKQNLKVTKKTKTLKVADLKKKAVTYKALTVKGNKGKLKYKKLSVNKSKAKFAVNKKNGKITVKKGTKKGTYKIKIRVTAAATTTHKAAKKNVTVTVKVR